MEDTDSSATRKRPRLDSGDRSHRSMSVDRLRDASTGSDPEKAPTSPADGRAVISPYEEAVSALPMAFTPSKVTINVRGPAAALQSSTPLPPDSPSLVGGGGKGIDLTAGDQDLGNKMEVSSPNVISVGSSPPQSPEIEVAEVEDMNDEPGKTRWQPLTSAVNAYEARHAQQTLLNDFPFRHNTKSIRKTLSMIALALEKSK